MSVALRCPFLGQKPGFMMMRSRLVLLERISRRYQTKTLPIRLGSTELLFTRIAEPDKVLDDAVAYEERRRNSPNPDQFATPTMPYWAELWESAQALAQIVARTPISGVRVLDLGCGMGLAGAAAAAMGAHVLMADLETTPLLLASLNTLAWQNRVRVRRVNWQTDRLEEQFDLILGADILYERAQWEYLDPFWRAHLAAGGAVMLGEPGRSTADQFGQWAADKGWQVDESAEPFSEMVKSARIFRLKLFR